MEIPKPIAIGIIALVIVLALTIGWYFTSGNGGAGSSVPQSAYPKSQGGEGVEAYGIQPPDTRPAPAEALPIGSGRGGGPR